MTNAEKAKLAVIVVAVVLLAAFVIDNTKKVNGLRAMTCGGALV